MNWRMFIGGLLVRADAATAAEGESMPVHEWPDGQLPGVSPDGKMVSLSMDAPSSFFARLTPRGWTDQWDKHAGEVRVDFVRLDGKVVVLSLGVSSIPTTALFAPDSDRV